MEKKTQIVENEAQLPENTIPIVQENQTLPEDTILNREEDTISGDTISTGGEKQEIITEVDFTSEKDEVLLQMQASRKWIDIRQFIKSPKKHIKKDPAYALMISIPIALFFMVVAGWKTGLTPAFDNVLLLQFS